MAGRPVLAMVVRGGSAVLWMGVIFFLSNTPDLRSGFDPTWDIVLRKSAHVVEYAVLAVLWQWALLGPRRLSRRAAVAGCLIAILYAATDEYHQSFVVGRNGNPIDWGIDAGGAIVGTFVFSASLRRSAKP